MNIVIDEAVKKNLTEDEYKYLLLLECSSEFEKAVLKARKELGIPLAQGVPDQKSLYDKSLAIMHELKIPIRLFPSVFSIVEWDRVMESTLNIMVLSIQYQLNRKLLYDPDLIPPPSRLQGASAWENYYLSNQYHISQSDSVESALPVIQINKRLTKTQLHEAIDNNWDEIARAMDDFEKSIPFPTEIAHVPLREIEEDVKLFLARKQGTPSLKVAADLTKEDQTIRKSYSRIKRLLAKLGIT